jgi:hypothetical protein
MVFKKKTASQQTTTAPVSNDIGSTQHDVSSEERARMVAEAAYYRAERRGFQNGDQTSDWYEAEKEVEVILSRPPQKARKQ